jgi:hypothetical protein
MRFLGTATASCLMAAGLSASLPTPGHGQTPAPNGGEPWIVTASHWGKWPTLAGAGTFIALAVVRNNEAKDANSEFRQYCAEDISRCALVPGPDGDPIYADPEAEQLFQVYTDLNRQARGFLAGGQVSLLVTGTMFLIDLVYQREGYDNIPYTPLELYSTPSRLGVALRF